MLSISAAVENEDILCEKILLQPEKLSHDSVLNLLENAL